MNPDENDKLWQLLGKARQPAVSPFFARNVLRALREEEGTPGILRGRGRWFRRWTWRLAAAGVCVAATVFTVMPGGHRSYRLKESASMAEGKLVGNPDYDVIKHLDELVADEESSVWLDDSIN